MVCLPVRAVNREAFKVVHLLKPGEWFDAKAIFHNFVANVLLALVTAVVLMLWSYLQGQSGPWVVIAGIAGGAAAMFALREIKQFMRRRQKESDDHEPVVSPIEAGERLFGKTNEREQALLATVRRLEDELRHAKDDSRRLDMVRARISEHAERGRSITTCGDMRVWLSAARQLVLGIAPRMLSKFACAYPSGRDDEQLRHPDIQKLEEAIASLRVIECNLRPEHLAKVA
jgi:hypothetical protein